MEFDGGKMSLEVTIIKRLGERMTACLQTSNLTGTGMLPMFVGSTLSIRVSFQGHFRSAKVKSWEASERDNWRMRASTNLKFADVANVNRIGRTLLF